MKEGEGHEEKGPGALVHPPVLFFAFLIGGLALHFLFPSRFVNGLTFQLAVGLPVIGVGVGLGGWAVRTLMKAGVDPRPHSPVSSLVVHGPFTFSRNPIYISGIVILLGVAVATDSLWLIILLPLGLIVISPQIKREEEYLEARFADEYRKYKGRVRRWL